MANNRDSMMSSTPSTSSHRAAEEHHPLVNMNKNSISPPSLHVSEEGKDEIEKKKGNKTLKIAMGLLFVLLCGGVLFMWIFYKENKQYADISDFLHFVVRKRTLQLRGLKDSDKLVLYGYFGENLEYDIDPSAKCTASEKIVNGFCFQWQNAAQVTVQLSKHDHKDEEFVCYHVNWLTLDPAIFSPRDCYRFQKNWYGLVLENSTFWPVSKNISLDYQPYLPNEGSFGPFTKPYWLYAGGVAIVTEQNEYLHVSWNKDQNNFCFGLHDPLKLQYLNLSYTLCQGSDLRHTHTSTQRYLREQNPSSLVKLPAVLKRNSFSHLDSIIRNEENVRKLYTRFHEYGMNCGVVLVDERWQVFSGDFMFDTAGSAATKKLLKDMSDAGCNAILNVSPFFEFKSKHFSEGLILSYFLRDNETSATKLLFVDGNEGAVLDVSNPKAMTWMEEIISNLTAKYPIYNFHTEKLTIPLTVKYFDTDFEESHYQEIFQSAVFQSNAVDLISYIYGGENKDVYIPVKTKVSVTDEVCLTNTIPTALVLNLWGFPFVISEEPQENLSVDLYTKWLQMSTFFPSHLFYTQPWEYGNWTLAYYKNLTKIHKHVLEDVILELYNNSDSFKQSTQLLISPVWWTNSRDATHAQRIDDEFMIGNKYLVAPLLCEGQLTRDIFMPVGRWKRYIDPENLLPVSHNADEELLGDRWVWSYTVVQGEIPVFVKINSH